MSELTVTFQDFTQARDISRYKSIAFCLEPPIQVHDAQVINKIVEPDNKGPQSGRQLNAPARDVILTHSDADATYGNFQTDWRYTSGNNERVGELREYLKASFETALNPMGNVAIKYVFLSAEQPQS
jgi:hypothetical protein